MKEYYNPEQAIKRCRCYLKCASQQPGESVAEFGRRIREYGRKAKLYELEDELTRYFFLSGWEDREIKEKLFDERLATFEESERRARELSDSRLMDVRARHTATKISRKGGQLREWRGEKMVISPRVESPKKRYELRRDIARMFGEDRRERTDDNTRSQAGKVL